MDRHNPTEESYLKTQDYFSQEKGLNISDYRNERDYLEIQMPLKKGVIRDNSKRAINHLDIHWRNTPLLTKFVTASSTIKSRYNNRLPKWQQKKMTNAIKMARTMNLIPYTGFIKSYHKKPLLNIHDDIETSNLRRVDIYTGAIKLEQPTTKWNETKNVQAKDLDYLDQYDESIDISSYNLTNYKFLTKEEDKLVKASRYANYLKENSLNKEELAELKNIQKTHWMTIENHNFENISSNDTLAEDKAAYDEVLAKFNDISPLDFIETKIAESAYDFKRLNQLEEEGAAYKHEFQDWKKDDLLKELNEFKAEAGIKWANSFKL